MTFSFVIPTYNRYDLVHQTLFDIYKHCSQVDEVIVMDDASPEEMSDGLNWWMTNKMLNVRHIRMKENKGFLKTSNAGLKLAMGDVVCLLSNDVRIHYDISKIAHGILTDEFPKSLIGGRLIWWDSGWNTFNGTVYPYIEGWLLCMTKEGWKDVGYFDERFAPYDYEDVDLSTSAVEKGYTLLPLEERYTQHIGAQSIQYGSEREAQTQLNGKKFEAKWVTK
jgi:GT2 family glycosyltransferase